MDRCCCPRSRDRSWREAGAFPSNGLAGTCLLGRSAQWIRSAGGAQMKCKANSAADVKETTPLLLEECESSLYGVWRESKYPTLWAVDSCYKCGIIMPTIGKPIRGDRGARQEPQQAGQDPGPRRRGRAESGTWKGPGSEVPRGRVLRSARHRAGQVRDAAPRIGRKCVGDQCDRRVRSVEADLLSDTSQLRGSGDRRLGAEEAGSARSTQGAGRGAGIYPRETDGGRAHSSAPAGRANPKEIRSRYPPKDDRASHCGKKNRALTLGGVRSERPATAVSQYEALRNGALGHVLAPEARWGLLLFLRRGMWGWAQVIGSAGASSSQPRPEESLSIPTAKESRAVIHIFAAMAMNAEPRGATP